MAVRFDAAGDDLRRTASLPTSTAFTICGWAQMSVDTNTYATVCSLESGTSSAANYLLLSTDSDGTSLKVWSSATGAASTTIVGLTVGTPFFFALTCSGTGATSAVGYYRAQGSNALTSVSYNGVSFTPGALFIANDSFSEPFSGRAWGVKVWDRVLSAAELLAESYFARPLFPTSLNCWWPLPNHSDTTDKSGNARNPTVTGTLTTEDSTVNLWSPRRKVFVPTAAGGGTATVTGAGNIASAEAFGTAVLSPRFAVSGAGGIASAEAFGTAVLTNRATVSPGGVASAEAFGTAVITWRTLVSPGGITSGEAFGTAVVTSDSSRLINGAGGITSAEAFGTAVVTWRTLVSPSGIASGEAFGSATVTSDLPAASGKRQDSLSLSINRLGF